MDQELSRKIFLVPGMKGFCLPCGRIAIPAFGRFLNLLYYWNHRIRTKLENIMKPFRRFTLVAAIATMPLIAACGTANGDGKLDMAQITATIEKAGFTCETQDRHPKKFLQVRVQLRSATLE